jgi:predicted amidohydrolase
MKVVMLQTSPEFGEVDRNLDDIDRRLEGVQADLVVLPELCTTGYQFRDRAELGACAEAADGRTVERMCGRAAACGGHLVFGFAERAGGRVYNAAAVVGPDGPLGTYRKVHLFADEKRLFDPGDGGFPVFDLGGVPVGIMVCFDWIFPEAARSLALQGALVIAHPANLVLRYCQDAMVTRAIENRIFTVTVNRVGTEERVPGARLTFTGSSRLVAPDGAVLADAAPDGPALLYAEIDPRRAREKHVTTTNHVLTDRRPDQYRLGRFNPDGTDSEP